MSDDRRVIVVGSGPAGAMASKTLLESGIPVTMLESGQAFPPGLVVRAMGRNLYRKWPWIAGQQRHRASGDPDAQWQHALTPGGLSNLWTGAVPRFAPEDFYEGERLHERYRWPISYEDLAPYYARAERVLQVVAERRDVPNLPAPSTVVAEQRLPGDWRRIAAQAEAAGHGLVPVPLANGPRWMVRRTGAAFNSFHRIVRALQRNPRFELLLGAHALRLEWRGDRRAVDSVVFVDRATGSERRLTAAAVVVAAGPLASTKLLLQSASADFPDGLGNTEGLLGRYLHDHPNDWCVAEFDRPLGRLNPTAYLTRAPHASSEPLLGASFTFGADSRWDSLLGLTPVKTKSFGLVTFGTMIPTGQNHVRLDPSERDEFGLPLLDLHIRYGEEVERNIATARERMLAIMDAAGNRCTVHCSVPRLIPGWSAHYGGTVRMHASPKHGMLDGWNRLHAVGNVVVADASSFTTGAEKNPTLTVMALAARAADRLAHDLRSGSAASREGLAHAVSSLRRD